MSQTAPSSSLWEVWKMRLQPPKMCSTPLGVRDLPPHSLTHALAGSYGWVRLLEFSTIVPCARFLPRAYTDFSSILHLLRKTRRWIAMEGEAPRHRCARIARPPPPASPFPTLSCPSPSPPPSGLPLLLESPSEHTNWVSGVLRRGG